MRPLGNCVNKGPIFLVALLVLEMHEDDYEEENEDEDSPARIVDNACRAPSVSALRGSRSRLPVYETHLSAIETNA